MVDATKLVFGLKDSFEEDVKQWMDAYEAYQDKPNLKELSKQSIKEIKERRSYRFTDEGNVRIETAFKIYDISIYYGNPDDYYFDVINLIKSLRHDMQYKESYISMRFTDGTIIRISSIHFLFNMIMWFPFFALGIYITRNELFTEKSFTNKSYQNFINTKLIEPYREMVTFNEMSKLLSRIYDLFIRVVERVSIYLGLSFSLYDLLKRWDTNPELKELNHTKIDDNMSIAEGEALINKNAARLQEIISKEEGDNQYRPLLESGQINSKQFGEFGVNISFKPDLEGKTIPTHPKANFINDGLRDPVDYVTDASGGRKAANLSLQIDASGYLQRTLCKSAADIYLHDDPNYDCGSVHYYERVIKTKKDLEDMRGRWYLDEDNNHLVQLLDSDLNLIGKKLKFRSPTTCASKHGICYTCYGYLASQNQGINIGINSAIKLMERLK